MPNHSTSCRKRAAALLRSELEELYAQRSALDAAIRELELQRASALSGGTSGQPSRTLEFSSKLCNLTSCRSA